MGRRNRTVLAAAGLVLMLVALTSQSPVLVLCAMVASTAGLLGRRVASDLVLPAASLCLVAAAALAGQGAHLLDVDLLARPGLVAGGYLLASAVALFAAARPSRASWTTAPVRVRHGWLVRLPALGAALVGAAQLVSDRRPAGWAFASTDLAQHMIMLGGLQERAVLDYTAEMYPRGLHMLLAMTAVPDAPEPGTAALLVLDMQVVAATTWLALAVLLWTTSSFVLRLAALRSVRAGVVVASALAAAALPLLDNDFLAAFVYTGAAPTLVAMVVVLALVLVPLVLVPRLTGPLPTIALLAVSLMLMAHLWQALIAVPAVAVLACGWVWRERGTGRARGRRAVGAGVVTLVVAGCATAAAPAVLGTLRVGGLEIAATPGLLPAVPMPALCVVLAVAAGLAAAGRRTPHGRMLAGTIGGILIVLAVLMAGAGSGFDLDQYYARKSLWFLWILLVPVASTPLLEALLRGGRVMSRAAARAGSAARVLRVAVVGSCAAVAFAYVLPQHLPTSSLAITALEVADDQAPSARRLAVALEHGRAHTPAVVVPVAVGTAAVPDRSASYIVSKLLSFQTGQPLSFGVFSQVCEDISDVAGGGPALVVSDLEPDLLRRMMDAQGCPGVPVVQVPGGGASSGFVRKVFLGELAHAETTARPG